MKQVPFGRSSLKISELCFGGNVFGWTVDEKTSFALLDAFVEAGGNFIDTADVYSRWVEGHRGGESEEIIGKWMKLRGNRSQIVLATKCGMEMGADKKGLSKAYMLRACEDSLQRLQTDYIDLYISHTQDDTVPAAQTAEAFAQLSQAGKIRVAGASKFTPEKLKETAGIYVSLQPLYNMYDREYFENRLLPVCKELGLAVTPYFSLAAGFLTGKYTSDADKSKSVRGARTVERYMTPRGYKIVGALKEVAGKLNCAPASVAIAWLLTRPTIAAPIASATSLTQLQAMIAATQIKLDENSLKLLEQASG